MMKNRDVKKKLVYSVGINDAEYQAVINKMIDGKWKIIWRCPYYEKWCSMLKRCYSKTDLERYPTYKGCSVCDEWKYFSNFRTWMIQQEWEGRCLDKDFLFEGNKVYSPSTCVFLPNKVNTFIITSGRIRGEHPLGVSLKKNSKKNPYQSYCKDGIGVLHYLGMFPIPEQAHQAWLHNKLKMCNGYLIEFKDEPLIIQGLTRIKNKIEHHINTNTELTSF